MRILKILSFGFVGLLVLFMMVTTVLEKLYGSHFTTVYIYGSPLFVLCWAALALSSILYIWRSKVQKQPFTFLLHLSFLVILLGAFVTHLFGLQGSVHLRKENKEPVQLFTTAEGAEKPFPFHLYLTDFQLDYYPGTQAPMNFTSHLVIKDGEESVEGEVSMNHIYSYRNYRFYQSKYDSDGNGTILSVSYDPWGIAVTYTGYGLLLLSICLFFFGKRSRFRRLLHHPLLKTATVCLFLLGLCFIEVRAKEAPRTLPRKTAEAFGNLYVYYNDRMCPLQTFAKDFTVKLYGKASYKGLTPEQVLTGWFFYYDYWKEEPCIRIKSKETQHLLGIQGEYARLTDFADIGGYKLDEGMQNGTEVKDKRGLEEANEKFSLISMVTTGSVWKLYPYISAGDSISDKKSIVWYSLTDHLPYDMPVELNAFVRSSMNYVAEQVARNDYQKVDTLLAKIRKYQVWEAGTFLPSDVRFKAEKWYNRLNNSRPLAMGCLTIGILAFIFYCQRIISRKRVPVAISGTLLTLLGLLFVYLCFTITLRGFISGHIPMSNGHETMQLMAACSALLTLFFYRNIPIVISFGFSLCGLALLVSMLGEANPQITPLMPVLSSPLLSFHVMIIMIAYSLLAFIMLNGITALILHHSRKECTLEVKRLQVISQILLYPAVFCLAIGIFIGAVWANVSWGRYWGWDPKEVWALITMLIYAVALHPASLKSFRRPLFFHLFAILAFFSVLVTYFGVNFVMGGMHSYAG